MATDEERRQHFKQLFKQHFFHSDNMATNKERRQHFEQLFNQHFERTRVARTACGDYCAEKCAPILIAFWYAWVGYVGCVGACGISCENGGIDIGNSTRFV